MLSDFLLQGQTKPRQAIALRHDSWELPSSCLRVRLGTIEGAVSDLRGCILINSRFCIALNLIQSLWSVFIHLTFRALP